MFTRGVVTHSLAEVIRVGEVDKVWVDGGELFAIFV
jgi:hypothetical protein